MYYTWHGWWWWLVWLVPMMLLLWVAFGWSGRGFGGYGRYGARDRYRDREFDGDWLSRRASSATRKHRNRAPRNYRRSDSRIQEDVCDRLMLDEEVDPSAIEVQVSNGVVALTGTAASRFEKSTAELIADSVAGVVDVDNRLKIGKVDSASQVQSDYADPNANR